MKLLELYSDYIISSFGQITATGLSKALEGEVNHDRITRFLSKENLDSKQLWKLVKPVVREHEQEEGVLIVDDTIEQKPHTKESELVCWHHDHQSNRSVKGINIINTNRDGSTGILYLACSDFDCDETRLEAIYKKQWNVEVFHKTLKSNTGLAKSLTKSIRTQSNHIFMSIYAAFQLECLKLKSGYAWVSQAYRTDLLEHKMNHFALRSRIYVEALQQAMCELHLLKSA